MPRSAGSIRTLTPASGQQLEDQGNDARIRNENIITKIRAETAASVKILEHEDNDLSFREDQDRDGHNTVESIGKCF